MPLTEEEKKERRRVISKRYYEANKDKHRDACARWAANNKDKVRESQRKSKLKHRDKINMKRRANYAENSKSEEFKKLNSQKAKDYYIKTLESRRENRLRSGAKYRKKNRNILNAKNRDACREASAALQDSYVKRCIKQGTSLRNSDIPQELIELKRLELKLKRNLKEQENG